MPNEIASGGAPGDEGVSRQRLESFHVHLYAAHPQESGESAATTDGRADSVGFDVSFEAAADALQELPKLYFEPDGSFVWAGPSHQIFGMLYDAADRLQYVELRGSCSLGHWRSVVRTLLNPDSGSGFVMVLPERQWKNLQRFESLFHS